MKSSRLQTLSDNELVIEKNKALMTIRNANGIRAKTDARKYLERITIEISKRK